MGKQDYWLNIYSSTVKFIQDQINYLVSTGVVKELVFRNLDDHAHNDTMPESDFIALRKLSANFDGQLIMPMFQIGVSTFEDQNLERHNKILNHLVNKMIPMETYPIVNHTNVEDVLGTMIFTDITTVQPFEKTYTRAIQFILAGAESTMTVQ